MDRLRAAFEEVVEIVKSALEGELKPPVEILLDEHLPLNDTLVVSLGGKNEPRAGIPTFVMNELASRTKNVVDYPCIQARIWQVLSAHQQNPNLMKKALNLLHYLLINGSHEVRKDTQSLVCASFLREIAAEYNKYEYEQYEFSQNLDIGAGVRKVAAEIVTLIQDDDALVEARQKAEKLHQSLSSRGLRSAYPTHAGMSLYEESRPPAYTDVPSVGSRADDDLASRIITHPSSDSDDDDEKR